MNLADLIKKVQDSGLHPISCFAPVRRDGTRQCVFGGHVTEADYLAILEATRKPYAGGALESGDDRARRRAEDAANRI